jgi:hypothetical protein
MAGRREILRIRPELLHVDSDAAELDLTPKFDWRTVYGYS